MQINLDVKALSVNKCWQGRRFKTKDYKDYEKLLLSIMPNSDLQYKDNLSINITFGFSNAASDIDNPLKPILDILQKKYKFNDRCIYELKIKKEVVKKGSEFINIKIKNHERTSNNCKNK